jgi:hypothetical protein
VDFLRKFNEKTTFIGVIYFNYKLRKHQSYRAVLESLARQVYEACKGTPTELAMEAMYQSHKKERTRPSEKELREHSYHGLGQFTTCYVILDALDEYVEQYSSQKIADLLDLVLSLSDNVKVLATSRNLEGMGSLFKELGASTEEIQANEEDMKMYVKNRIAAVGFDFDVSEEIHKEIVERVVTGAKGRYVNLCCLFQQL